jgi:beta-phosphoglucomutase-like phosphatase (HAD superfamily)
MSARKDSAFLFDLDGTLIDSVYQHVIALLAGRDLGREQRDVQVGATTSSISPRVVRSVYSCGVQPRSATRCS